MSNHFCIIFYPFLLLFAQNVSCAQGSWDKIPFPNGQMLNSVCFTDSLYGWVAGDSGTIIHTTDGGKTWNVQESHTQNEISEIFFLNRNIGWAASLNFTTIPNGTLLLKTTNGGTDWTGEPYPEENIFITCIFFRDSLHGWIGGRPHALAKTTNGGIDWAEAAVDTSTLAFFPVLGIQFYNDKYGYACGGMFDIAGVIWRASNGGEKWYAIDPAFAPADEVHALHLFDSLHIMGAGGDPDFGFGAGIIRSSDGGINWHYQELGFQGNLFDLDFRTDAEAWAPLGSQRKLIYSLNAGSTWTQIPTPDSTAIFDMIFPDSLHGFAVGAKGAMLKYKPADMPAVNPLPVVPYAEFYLYQNNPNPFRSVTRIKFKIPPVGANLKLPVDKDFTPVQLKVFDVSGREVATLVDQDLAPGDHEILFNAADLPGGIYFYRLQLSISGKVVICGSPRKLIFLK